MIVLLVKDKNMKVIRFTASWCSPCKMLAKTLEELETDIEIEVDDIDSEDSRAGHFQIRSVPTLVMIADDGQEIKRLSGAKGIKELNEWFAN